LQDENEDNNSSAFDELGRLGEELEFISEDESSVFEKKKKRTKNAKKERPQKQQIHYTTRGKKYCYCEAEVPDDDHYICKLNY